MSTGEVSSSPGAPSSVAIRLLQQRRDHAAGVPDRRPGEARRVRRGLDEAQRGIRTTPGARPDLRYGEGARHRLEVFPCGAPAASTLVYMHGGYWQISGLYDLEPFRLNYLNEKLGLNAAEEDRNGAILSALRGLAER